MLNNLLNIFSRNKKNTSNQILNIQNTYPSEQLFLAVNDYSKNSEIRYVGGCVRKSILNEKIDDVDLSTNLDPIQLEDCLKKNNIKYLSTGKKFGTLTALVNGFKFEITSLRKDIITDGRHAKVEYTNNWKEDAERRDFTFNSIYANINGEIFDPFNGKNHLRSGKIFFIGDPDKRIKEDYLRILRYIRFFLNYSNHPHDKNVTKAIKQNIEGIKKISKERLLDELRKIVLSSGFLKIKDDKFCLEIIQLIFPQISNLEFIKKNSNEDFVKLQKSKDFILILSLLIIDLTDNTEYFLHKFNLSNEDKNRIIFLNDVFKNKLKSKYFSTQNLMKILYTYGRERLLDIIRYQSIRYGKKENFKQKIDFFEKVEIPKFPLNANLLIDKYNFKKDKILGNKIKELENFWLNNNFKISKEEVLKIVKN